MTPNVIGLKVSNTSIVELSRGEGFDHELMYGVTFRTIRELKNGRKDKDNKLCKSFFSKSEAEDYFNSFTEHCPYR